jgi:hypothetical protein
LDKLDAIADEADPLHAETLIAGVLALSPDKAAARRLAWRRAQSLFPAQSATQPAAHSQPSSERLRTLRAARAVLTQPAPVPAGASPP